MSARHTNRRSGEEGFTLIEVLMALAILGTGLFVLLETHSASLRLFGQAQEMETMRIFVEQVVGESERAVLHGEESYMFGRFRSMQRRL